MILQRGTTGFQHCQEPQLPLVDLRAFRCVFHTVARDLSATVIHSPRRRPETECSFADALLEIGADRIAVLLNCFHPLIAFASPSRLDGNPEFRDHAELARAFSERPEFTVLSTDVLTQFPSPDMLVNLSPTEIEQLNYWKPSQLGDVIFNHWD